MFDAFLTLRAGNRQPWVSLTLPENSQTTLRRLSGNSQIHYQRNKFYFSTITPIIAHPGARVNPCVTKLN